MNQERGYESFVVGMKSLALYYLRVLAILGKAFGAFPLQRVRFLGNDIEGGPRFRYCSWAFLYGLVCVPVGIFLYMYTPVLVLYLYYPSKRIDLGFPNGTAEGRFELDDILPTSGSTIIGQLAERIVIVQVNIMLVVAYLINLFKGRQLVKLLHQVQTLEKEVGLDEEDYRCLRRFGYLLPLVYVWICLWFVCFLIYSRIMPSWCDGACKILADLSFSLPTWFTRCCPVTTDVMFIYLCKFLELISVRNLDHLKDVLQRTKTRKGSIMLIPFKAYYNEIDVSFEIERRRKKYLEICDLADYLSTVFHPTILLRIVFNIVLITTTVFLTVGALETQNLFSIMEGTYTAGSFIFFLVFVTRAGGHVRTKVSVTDQD